VKRQNQCTRSEIAAWVTALRQNKQRQQLAKVDEEWVAAEHEKARVRVLIERERKMRVEPNTPGD